MKMHKKIVGLLVATSVSFLLFSCSGGGGGGGEAGEGGEGSSEQNNASNDKNNTSGGSAESKDYAPETGKLFRRTLTSSRETVVLWGAGTAPARLKFNGNLWAYDGGYDYRKTGKNKGTLNLTRMSYPFSATVTMWLERTGDVTFNSPTSVTWDYKTTTWVTGGNDKTKHESSACTTFQMKAN